MMPVSGVIAFIVYSWSILEFLKNLPAWIKFLSPGEIFIVFSYVMFGDLIESAVFLVLIMFVSMILPMKLLRDEFALRGSIIAFAVLGSIVLYWVCLYPGNLILSLMIIVLSMTFFFVVAKKIKIINRGVTWFSERLSVFLYLYIPISLISILVVIIRNFL